ncbi:MAG: SigE family RNA polymerase sigma factor [Acidimicrobiia bacterium]|nr:SigE family RNA polymerase sigma factor [Acidimicrobiia bacterium]
MGGAVVTGPRRTEDLYLHQGARGETFEELFETHKGYAYRLALLLSGGETATAEDAVSEAFARVLPRWQAGDVEDFGAYVRRAVVNQVKRTFLRRGFQRRSEALIDLQPSYGSSYGSGPEDQVVHRQVLWGALRSIAPKQRAAVVLHYYEALPVDEVAAVMGTSVGTAKSHLSRGRGRLRELLGERP